MFCGKNWLMTNLLTFFRKITTKLLYLKEANFSRYLTSWLSEAIFFCGILFGRWKKFLVEYNFAVGNLNVEFSFCCSTIYNKYLIKIAKSWFWQDSRKFDFVDFEKFYGNLISRILAKTAESDKFSFQENLFP